MDLSLKDSVVIVSGGSQGIGRGIAKAFAVEGAKVAIAARGEDKLKATVDELKALGADAMAVKTDVANLEATDNLAKKVVEQWGKIDVIVHSAALFSIQRFMDTPVESWSQVINVSQYGAMNLTRSVLPYMIKSKKGRIIYIASDAGRVGDPFQPVYAAAKGAVMAFGKSIAQDVGRYAITVNTICPALTVTEENLALLQSQYGYGDPEKEKKLVAAYPLRKIGTVEEVASMVLFVASNKESQY